MTKFIGETLTLPKLATAPASPVDGDMYYNTTTNTLYGYIGGVWTDLAATGGGGGGSTTIAESVRAAVRNVSGATIDKGSIVMLSGVNGQKPTITKAIATGDVTSAATFGWVESAISNNSDGYVTTFGILNNLDTSAFTDGQYLYLSGTTAGAATNVKTYAPVHNVTVGFVIKGNSVGAGQVFVYIKNGFELDELHDVATHDYPPTDGQVLTYESSSSLWKPSTRVVSVSGTSPISSSGGSTPTISVAAASTSAAGVVQLTDSTSTTSSTVAATATAAKSAYDRGSLGVTNAATAQSTADSKVASVSGTGAISSTGGTTPTISVASGSTTTAGVVQLTDSTSSTSTTTAATPNSVKSAYDLASTANTTANAAVPQTRTLTGTAPITVGGVSGTGQDLSANRTIAVTAASTSASGVVQLTDSTSTTSSTLAATATAAKAAYDRGSQGVSDAATAQSTANAKANPSDTTYVGTTAVTLNRTSTNQALTGITSVTMPGSTSGSAQITPSAVAGSGTTITLPATSGTVALTNNKLSDFASPTATVDFNNQRLTGLGTPTAATDAATKTYVDNVTAGINTHGQVVAASTANISGTYADGTNDQSSGLGIGATFTASANGAISLDTVSPALNDRVLLKDQTSQLQNGIYTVTTVGTVSTPFVLTRATDANNSIAKQVSAGDFVYVNGGTANGGQGWVMNSTGTATGGAIKLGTDALNWVQFSGVSSVTAGDGLTRSGNTLNVATANTGRIVVSADAIDLAAVTPSSGTGTAGINFVQSHTVDTYGRVTATTTADVRSASTTQSGIVQLEDTPSTSTSYAATSNAVKNVKTTADAAVPGTRTLTGTTPITIGGVSGTGQDLTANRTIAVNAASTTASGVVQLEDTPSTSTTKAATSNAVYNVKSTADAAATKATTLTGTAPITIDGANTAKDLSASRTIAVSAASTTAAGVVQLEDTPSTSTTKAATSNAVYNKNKVYYQATTPTGANTGDVWVNPNDNTVLTTYPVASTSQPGIVQIGSVAPGAIASSGAAGSQTTVSASDHTHAGVTSITGTSNQVTASASAGAVTLSLPQSVATTSTPSFSQATLTGGDSTTSTSTASLNLVGYNQRGGVGYHGFLDVKSTYGSGTTLKKFFRLDSAGTLQIINDGYSANIFNLTDAGALTIPSLTVNGTITGNKSGTLDVNQGVFLTKTANQSIATTTISTTPTTANTTAVTWSSATKANTNMWTTGSVITAPLAGFYAISTCFQFGTGTAYACAGYIFQGSTLVCHQENQAGSNTSADMMNLSTVIYCAANDQITVRVAASAASKNIIQTSQNGFFTMTYLGAQT